MSSVGLSIVEGSESERRRNVELRRELLLDCWRTFGVGVTAIVKADISFDTKDQALRELKRHFEARVIDAALTPM